MLSRIHQKLGTAGFIISIVALVAALGGGAYAASSGLSGKQKKEVEKIAKKYAGKPGAAGPAGPAGAKGDTGAKGDAGTAGANGAAGANGTAGTDGTNGTSVTNTALAKGNTHCSEGGAELKVGTGTATFACNGTSGFTSTLPSGQTETGAWAIGTGATSFTQTFAALSFPIPLAAEGLEETSFAFNQAEVEGGEFGKHEGTHTACVVGEPECVATGCGGTVANPTAAKGVLCVFTEFEALTHAAITYEVRSFGGGFGTYGKTGAQLVGPFMEGHESEPASVEAAGTFAVTAP